MSQNRREPLKSVATVIIATPVASASTGLTALCNKRSNLGLLVK
jgi:hypothetical protein